LFFCLNAAGILPFAWGWFGFGFGFGLSCDAGVVCFCCRWHPRFVLPASGVAPVRGGTYFLCRRKESKQRKRANTARS
jgi:hypothetical protein